jgi:hypothetical protein
MLHEPQCVTSVRMSMHAPPHTLKPCSHMHTLSLHSAPIGHVRPHALQFRGSPVMSTHPPAQLTVGGEQLAAHFPASHT